MDSEITDTEHGGEHSRSKSGATGDGFVLVEGGGKGHSREDGLDLGANSGDTGAPTDEFNGIDLFEGKARILKNLGKGSGYTIEDAGDESLVLLPRHL